MKVFYKLQWICKAKMLFIDEDDYNKNKLK